jgi:putative transposase
MRAIWFISDVARNATGLTRAIITLADRYSRYGYRRITIELREAGWNVGKDRVERIWCREGLKVPQKQKPRGRLDSTMARAVAAGPPRSCLVI